MHNDLSRRLQRLLYPPNLPLLEYDYSFSLITELLSYYNKTLGDFTLPEPEF
jgi:hypothetical protein